MKKQFIYLAAFIAFTVASCTVLEDKRPSMEIILLEYWDLAAVGL